MSRSAPVKSHLFIEFTTFGDLLRYLRQRRQLTQRDLALAVGYSISQISRLEHNERLPDELTLQAVFVPALGLAQEPATVERLMVLARQARTGADAKPAPAVSAPEMVKVTTTTPPSAPGSGGRSGALPLPAAPLIGRENELAALRHSLANPTCRLLTFVGSGGIGKTRLALALAASQQEVFVDGVYFVALAPLSSPTFIVSAIANALHFTFVGASEPKTQLLDYLRTKQLLLLLDNMEHLLPPPQVSGEGVELLVELLQQAAGVKLLVTSRERLNLQDEWVFDLHGLPVPPDDEGEQLAEYSAVALFVERAQRVQAGFALTASNQAAIVRICRLVEGLPLGIELAAAWVYVLSCQAIAQEIAQSIDFLAVARRDLPARQRSLRATFDYSWQLLTPEEQRVMRQLAVFRGGFVRAAAGAVAGATLANLAGLVNKSLVRVGAGGRYDLHELVRQYAYEQLAATGEMAATQQHHSHYFGQWLQQKEVAVSGPQQMAVLQEFALDLDNLRTGWRWAVDHASRELLTCYHESLCQLYAVRGWYDEGAEMFAKAATALRPQAAGDPQAAILLGRILAREAVIHYTKDAHEPAGLLLAESLRIFEQQQAWQEQASVYLEAGNRTAYMGAFHEAIALFRQSLALYQGCNDESGMMGAWAQLGWAQVKVADLDAGVQSLQTCLTFFRTRGAPNALVWIVKDLGDIALYHGDYAEAADYYTEALTLAQALEYPFVHAFVSSALGRLALDRGDYPTAQAHYVAAAAIFRRLGNVRRAGYNLCMLAYIALLTDNLAEATTHLAQTQTWLATHAVQVEPFWYSCIAGELALVQGKADEAEVAFRHVLVSFDDADDTGILWGVAWAYHGLGRLCIMQGADSQAWAYFQQALAAARPAPFIPEVLDVLVGMALLLARAGQTTHAIHVLAAPLWDARHRQQTALRARQVAADLDLDPAGKLPTNISPDAQTCLVQAIHLAMTTTL